MFMTVEMARETLAAITHNQNVRLQRLGLHLCIALSTVLRS